jgi:hypothetical protein
MARTRNGIALAVLVNSVPRDTASDRANPEAEWIFVAKR